MYNKHMKFPLIRQMLRLGAMAALAVFPVITSSTPAAASFPGSNGRLIIGRSSLAAPPAHDGISFYSLNPDGTGSQTLTDPIGYESVADQAVAWSPQGSNFAFIKKDGLSEPAIYLASADGSGQRRIGPFGAIGTMTWSPDGSLLAVADQANQGLYILDLSTGSYDVLIDSNVGTPKWSPDGSLIAFSFYDGSYNIIYTYDVQSEEVHQVSDDGVSSFPTDWSPDSSRLAYIMGAGLLHFMDPDGLNDTAFNDPATPNTPEIWNATWSPDGTKIAYVPNGHQAEWRANPLFIVNGLTATSPKTQIATDAFPGMLDWQATGNSSYVYRFWSPKNQHHFYTANFSEATQVMTDYPNDIWTYEGIAYQARQPTDCAGKTPVHRFWSRKNSAHFFTISAQEKSIIESSYPDDVWHYEGVAFCASTTQTAGTKPLYRFWSDKLSGHFFTSNPQEKDSIIANYPTNVWRYEGVAYYVE
jgi:Tol biopolymer transport system component